DERRGPNGARAELRRDLVDRALGVAPVLVGVPQHRTAAARSEVLGAHADEAYALPVADELSEGVVCLVVDAARDIRRLGERARARDRAEVAVAQLERDR